MINRRTLLSALAAPPLLQACTSGGSEAYESAMRRTWRLGPLAGLRDRALLLELVRYATLAPSSHNTQCWKFALEPRAISILPDWSRRCPAVDADDHHLFVSLGCAAENLLHAARALGLRGRAAFERPTDILRLELEPAPAEPTARFKAIPHRQSTRSEYDGKALSATEIRQLQEVATGDGVQLLLLTERSVLEQVLELVIEGNTAQMNDPAFVEELLAWIRYNGAEALQRGDGLYAGASGNPTLPTWLGRRLFPLVFRPDSENDKYARHVRSSAGIAVFFGPAADKAGWTAVGRTYQRFALEATAMGIRTAHLNQPVEVPALREPLAQLIGMSDRRPDLVIRFGRGPALPPSPRRPVEAVLA